jgi:hypothetical protein
MPLPPHLLFIRISPLYASLSSCKVLIFRPCEPYILYARAFVVFNLSGLIYIRSSLPLLLFPKAGDRSVSS